AELNTVFGQQRAVVPLLPLISQRVANAQSNEFSHRTIHPKDDCLAAARGSRHSKSTRIATRKPPLLPQFVGNDSTALRQELLTYPRFAREHPPPGTPACALCCHQGPSRFDRLV